MSQLQNPIGLFEDMAAAISAKYLAAVKIMSAKQGARPPFDELMAQLKLMEQELTKQGVQFLEDNRTQHGDDNDEMTNRLKDIIRKTIEGFIKQL